LSILLKGKYSVSDHQLIATLKNLEGNPRACVFTEPLWGIPYNLYAPYASVYMLALGVRDSQIGLLISINFALQIGFALISGALTDKFGRKRTTFISDLFAWSVPCFLWAIAQNFNFFLLAVIFNSVWRVSGNSWTCLLVEDARQDELVNIYAWVYISGLLAAFFAPLAGLLIHQFTLIPTVRALYVFSLIMMTIKFVVMNRYVTETRQGAIRMQETKNQPLLSLFSGYRDVMAQILRTPKTLITLGIMLVMSIYATVNGTFWGILVTEKLHIPTEHLAIYPTAKSLTMLLFFFLITPRLSSLPFRNPMLVGFTGFILSQVLLITMPAHNYILLLGATLLEACSVALANPLVDSMVVKTVDAAERARIMALLYLTVILFTSPFGWIAGKLSEIDRSLPFALNVILCTIGFVLVILAARAAQQGSNTPELAA
jgi:MFS family permease